jgi:hypothetical protein
VAELSIDSNKISRGGILLGHISQNRSIYFYCFLICLVLIRSFLNYPSITWRAEFWAESGTNFFCHAQETFSLGNFLILDSGYFAILPRALSFLTVTIFGAREYAPHAQQIIGFILVAVLAGSIVHGDWGEKKPNYVLRLILASALVSHWGYGMFVFNNMAYFAVIPAMSFLCYSIETLKRYVLPISLFMPFVILNKPYLLAFAPVYLVFALYLAYKREFKASLPFWVGTALICIQLLVASANRRAFAGSSAAIFSLEALWRYLKAGFYFVIYAQEALLSGFYSRHLEAGERTTIAIFFLTSQVFALCWVLYIKHVRAFCIALSAMFVAYVCELMTTVVFFPEPLDLSQIPSFLDDSHHFFAFALFFIATTVLFSAIFDRHQWLACVFLLIISASSNVFGFWHSVDPIKNNFPGPTSWEQQIPLFRLKNEFVSINPLGWKFRPSDCAKISP